MAPQTPRPPNPQFFRDFRHFIKEIGLVSAAALVIVLCHWRAEILRVLEMKPDTYIPIGDLFGLYRAPGNRGSRWTNKKSTRKPNIGTFGQIIIIIYMFHPEC